MQLVGQLGGNPGTPEGGGSKAPMADSGALASCQLPRGTRPLMPHKHCSSCATVGTGRGSRGANFASQADPAQHCLTGGLPPKEREYIPEGIYPLEPDH